MATRIGRKQFVDSSQKNGTDTEDTGYKNTNEAILLSIVKRIGYTQRMHDYQNREEAVCSF